MWASSDGTEVKKILKRIDKIKLSDFSEDLLFEVLFTNAYSPKTNLSQEELGLKINEKSSVIRTLESGKLKPTDTLAKKIERFLKIKILITPEK